VSLVESGAKAWFGTRLADCATGETSLAKRVVAHLAQGMLRRADRNFFSYSLWKQA
jgi:hypothetical protein